jgi:hypothetical protein
MVMAMSNNATSDVDGSDKQCHGDVDGSDKQCHSDVDGHAKQTTSDARCNICQSLLFDQGLLEEGQPSHIYLLLEGDSIPLSTSNKRRFVGDTGGFESSSELVKRNESRAAFWDNKTYVVQSPDNSFGFLSCVIGARSPCRNSF